MADRKKLKTVRRGRPKTENCANYVKLWIKYGSSTAKSFVNLFNPSLTLFCPMFSREKKIETPALVKNPFFHLKFISEHI